jgi:hypothetical protein
MAAIVALVMLVGLLTPPAVAQIRAAFVRDVDGVARGVRYIENQTFIYPEQSFFVNETITPAIPAGKKLVLQRASVHSVLTNGQSPMEVRVSIGAVGVIGYVPQVLQATSTLGQSHFTGAADLEVVVNEGESVLVSLIRNNNLGGQEFNFSRVVLTGHLVDVN